MADQEIAKHTKNIWAVMATSQHGIWHKLREILLEIVIIVFAVSMSIWLHSVGEHRHEQAQVKTFLLGLKSDIQSDLEQIEEVVAFHHDADEHYAYLASLDPTAAPERDKFNKAYRRINTNNFLVPRVARYEGFKSSGKLINVENDALLEKIVNLYQYDIPKASLSSGGWLSNHAKLLAFVEAQTGEDDSLTARYKMITSRKGKLLNEHAVTYHQLYERFQTAADNGKAIIAEIDKAYPNQAH
jgi:hypothetical protein